MYPSKPSIYYFSTNCITVLPLYGRAVLYILTVIAHCALFWESFCMAVYWFGIFDSPALFCGQTCFILFADVRYFISRLAVLCVQANCIQCTDCCICVHTNCIFVHTCCILLTDLLYFVYTCAVFYVQIAVLYRPAVFCVQTCCGLCRNLLYCMC